MKTSVKRGRSNSSAVAAKGARSLTVMENRPRTTAPHGLSHHERNRLTEGMDYLRERGPCVFVSIEAGRPPDAEAEVRELTRRIRSVVAQSQRRAGMRKIVMVTVFEALDRDKEPKFGAHIVAHLPDAAKRDRLIQSLNGSKAYGKHVLAKRVEGWAGLTTYLLKEATQQAQYRRQFRRIGGSIPLGVRGGDRVILSNELRDILLNDGRIKPYLRSYAKRTPSVSMQAVAETATHKPSGTTIAATGNVIVARFGVSRSIDDAPEKAKAA